MNQHLLSALATVSANLDVTKALRMAAMDEWHRIRGTVLSIAERPGSFLPRHD